MRNVWSGNAFLFPAPTQEVESGPLLPRPETVQLLHGALRTGDVGARLVPGKEKVDIL